MDSISVFRNFRLKASKTDAGGWISEIEVNGKKLIDGNGLTLADAQRYAVRMLESEVGVEINQTALVWTTDLPHGVREYSS